MKILKLRFKNLNSLYEEWAIDFTSPEYVLDRIFAITGPTGAGKSTILDAVCLALYGRTPRLKLITKSQNEIMSRQTGECFAEVIFETQAGRFLCHWSQRRARQKPDGNLLESKHEISDAVSNKILESKKRDVAVRIEQITGMDFDRFTRSMLLAQGGFAAFLEAAPDQRAPILEQITGTMVYSDISKLVHERRSDEHKKLDLLLAQSSGITLLGNEEEAAVNLALAGKKETEKNLHIKSNDLERSILWLTGIDALKSELAAMDKESEHVSNELKEFEPDRKRLQKADTAAELDSAYATLSAKRQQQQSDLKTLADAKTQVPDQEKNLELKQTHLKNAEAAIAGTREEQKTELSLIKKVRAQDLYVSEKKAALKNALSDCQSIETRVLEKKEQQKNAKRLQASAEKDLSRIKDYLSANARDAQLVTHLTGMIEQIRTLQDATAHHAALRENVSEFKKQLEAGIRLHKKQAAVCHTLKEKQDMAVKQVAQARKALETLLGDRLLREYRTEYESLLREMAYLKKISTLEEERAGLTDGSPCPLCGSLHHPFALGNVPGINETEKKVNTLSGLILKAETLETELKTHESSEKSAGINLAEADKQLVQALHRKNEAEANFVRLEKEAQTALETCTRLKKQLALSLEPFGIGQIPDAGPDTLLEALKTRQKKWQAYQKQEMDIEKKINDLAAMASGLDETLKTLEESGKERQTVFAALQKDLETLTRDRSRMYGDKNPDAEEARLETRVMESEKLAEKARQDRDSIKQKLDDLKTRITALKESCTARQTELENLESAFIKTCSAAGFEDEPTLISHRLPIEERTRLSQKARALDEKQADIAFRKKDRETRLFKEKAAKVTDRPLEHLKEEQTQTRETLKMLGEQIGAIKQKLSDNTAAKAKLREKKVLIDLQRAECTRWDSLHALIGSADGKKYRNFAQGITFEVMVSHANRQLEKMTDRYLLIRDEKQPLELNIVDNYQAGEIRSTKNLSGGESFIVSLSLALGLSHMSSRNVRVDSLFLDEGFGTLDEDALETSLEALSGLQQEGKLIGIISHVPALKQRISTRITINPVSGGKSRITGPGCRAIHSDH